MSTATLFAPLSTTGVPLTGKITFAAFSPKTQLPVTLRPCNDKTGKLYTGQGQYGYFENLTEEEKKSLIIVIDHATQAVIEDGTVLDLDNPIDAANWKWIQRHPYVCMDKAVKKSSNRDAVYYIVNAQKEAQLYVDTTAGTDEARPAIRKLSLTDQTKVAKVLGLHASETFPPAQLLSWLLQECNTRPGAVLEAINPENARKVNAKIFFDEALRWGIIARGKDGNLYYGGEKGVVVGINEQQAIEFLLSPENAERTRAMKAAVVEKTKTLAPVAVPAKAPEPVDINADVVI